MMVLFMLCVMKGVKLLDGFSLVVFFSVSGGGILGVGLIVDVLGMIMGVGLVGGVVFGLGLFCCFVVLWCD